jgi:Zn-dependent M16 (insulinase) family peptidase
MSLPTIESSFVTYTTKSIQGFSHPEHPAIQVAAEVLNATESYLWVGFTSSCITLNSHMDQRYIRGSGLAYGAYVSLDLEAGLLSFSLYRVCTFGPAIGTIILIVFRVQIAPMHIRKLQRY